MNPYKAAWYSSVSEGLPERPALEILSRLENVAAKDTRNSSIMKQIANQSGQSAAMGGLYRAAGHAAQSQLKGRVGVAFRIGGRVGLRVIPVVGVALLVYDLYQLASYLAED